MKHDSAQRRRFPWQTALVLVALWTIAATVFTFLENAALVLPAAACATALIIAAGAFPARAQTVADYAFRYRWVLAGLLFIVCVCLRIHGSSIGMYDEVFSTQIVSGDSTLFGKPRWIRSDEFGVATPLFFSQFFNGYGLFSQQISLSPTNMVVDYYSPVWDIMVIGKPLCWGYLLFGSEVGLSWYWCAEEILIFMTAFEMCLILLRGRRFESMLGAVAIWLAPQTQWWVVPHIPIVFMYAMGLFCLGYAFFTATTHRVRWASAAGATIALVGFALSVFPSLQVPCAYIIVVLLAVCLYRDRGRLAFSKRDWPPLGAAMLATLAIFAYFFVVSQQDIALLLNTAYPGERVDLGGNWRISGLFPNLMCLFLPYMDATYANNCVLATSIHFAPLFLLLFPRMFVHLKRSDAGNLGIGIALVCILVVEIVFLMVGIPRAVADITLLRFCNRMYLVYGWTAVLFTVWGFSALLQHPNMLHTAERIAYPLVYIVISFALVDADMQDYFAQLQVAGINIGWPALVLTLAGFAVVLACTFFNKQYLLGGMFALLLVFSGATVNPIEQGASAITNHPVSAEITRIASEEPESRWLCTDCTFFLSNYVAANGARVANGTNYYPDIQKWRIIDPLGIYDEETNRYANETATLTKGENSVELLFPDSIKLRLNPETLKELEIRYLFSHTDYTQLLLGYGIACECVASQDGYGIYRLSEIDD